MKCFNCPPKYLCFDTSSCHFVNVDEEMKRNCHRGTELILCLRGNESGRRDSNPLPKAWEAFALPGELLPLIDF